MCEKDPPWWKRLYEKQTATNGEEFVVCYAEHISSKYWKPYTSAYIICKNNELYGNTDLPDVAYRQGGFYHDNARTVQPNTITVVIPWEYCNRFVGTDPETGKEFCS